MEEQKKGTSFIPGGQILTNLEDYSLQVRSEVDAYAKKVRSEADQLKKSTKEDIESSLKKRLLADDEAAELLGRAKEEAEELLRKSQTQGFEKGYRDGEKKFHLEIDQRMREISNLLSDIQNHRDFLYLTYEKDLLKLCLIISQKLVVAELKSNPKMLLASLQRAAKNMGSSSKVRVFLNDADYDYILKKSADLAGCFDDGQSITLKKDPSIKAGDAKLEADFSSIELNLENQFKQIEKSLLTRYDLRRQAYLTDSVKKDD
ncbi:MAG: hypothetical protein JJV97_02825 [SAR324 cluster bacterium]|nr:hypothetical protein [SAR324 cluster bacterium]